MQKTLLFHDTFLMKGGAERMNIEIARATQTDIATAVWSKDCYDARAMGFSGDIHIIDPKYRKGMIGFLMMKWHFFNSANITSKYETIFFSNEAITGIWRVKPGTKTAYYAHSISRHLFDQKKQYLSKVPLIIRPFFSLFSVILRSIYKREIQKIDTIFVNSESNKKRMLKWLGRDDAIVIYPGVDTEKFDIFSEVSILQKFAIEGIEISYKEYYLSFSRLTHAKRIDTIIEAFKGMPDKKVLILYGENDSQKDEFIKLGRGFPNIVFHTLADNNHLSYCINGAIATISISREEDFGMVAIESMSCGVPVIAVNEGGYQESLIDGKTGFLIDSGNLKQNLQDTILIATRENCEKMQYDSRRQAEQFSLETMIRKIKHYLQ